MFRFPRASGWIDIIKAILFNMGICFLLLILIISSPILLPLAVISSKFSARKKQAAANKFHCSNCDKILGQSAITLADAEWQERIAQWTQENPGIRLQLSRKIHGICSNCGNRFTYLEKTHSFKKLE